MAAVYGKSTTYNETTLGSLKVSIEDLVGRYPKKDFPLLNRLNSKVFEKEVDSVKYEWKEENLRPVKDVLGAAITSTSATTITVTTAGVFNVDDVIQIGSEQMIVTGVATNGIDLTVSRGWASTTAATALIAATAYRIGVAAPEGKDADGMVRQPFTDLYNRTQIFEDVVEMSGTEEQSFIYRTNDGDTNSSNQITKKQQELMEMLQTAILLGRRGDDGISRRSMGGLKFFIDTYAAANAVDMGGASSWTTASDLVVSGNLAYIEAQERLDNAVEKVITNRGKPTALYVGYKALRRMSLWNIDRYQFTNRKEDTRGFTAVGTYLAQSGPLDVVQIPGDALNDLMFVVDENRIGYKPFKNRGWFTKKLAENGDSSKWQVLGEYTFKMNTPLIGAYLYNLGL